MTDMNRTETAVHNSTAPKQVPAPVAPGSSVEYSIPYILTQMAAIQGDTAYIHDALNSLTGVISDTENSRDINLGPGAVMADDPRSSAADAVKHIVLSRETTNQQLLRMYDKMLTHLTGISDANVMGRDGKRFWFISRNKPGCTKCVSRLFDAMNDREDWYLEVNGSCTEEESQAARQLLLDSTALRSRNMTVINMIQEEAAACFAGDKSPDETARILQSRMSIYLGELS